MISEISLDAED